MARYCVKCGKELKEGEICSCRIRKGEGEASPDGEARNGVEFRALFRLDQDMDKGEDYYERGKLIVPELVDACEQEIPVKQYHLVNIRSRFRGLWAEGRLMITNKRLMFRASGRSFIGRTQLENEYSIDEISGIEISRGIRFSIYDFLVNLLLLALCIWFFWSVMSGLPGWFFQLFLAVAGIAGIFFLKGKYFRSKMILCSISLMGFFYLARHLGEDNGFFRSFFVLLSVLALLLLLVFLFLSAMKSVVSLNVKCKSGTGDALSIQSPQHFMLQTAQEIIPTEETDTAMREIGSIISDIQHLGDYGIEKWQTEECKEIMK